MNMADEDSATEHTHLLGAQSHRYVVSETEIRGQVPSEYVVYRRRWYILAVVCLLNISNALMWLSFSPIADITAQFYQVGASDVNWLSLVFPIATIPCVFIASWFLDTVGLRVGIISAAWLNVIGAILRVLSTLSSLPSNYAFPLVISGQTLAACGQPFLLLSPTKVAGVWFKDTQRTTANMLSSMANPLGILLANVLSPLLCKQVNQLPLLMELYAIPAGIGVLMATFGVCSSVPPTPPTPSAAEESESFFVGLKKVAVNKTYWILALCFGVGMGLFTALTTLLEQILCARGYSDSFAGLTGALLIGVGLLGAASAGIYVDRTKKFEEVAKLSYGMAAVFFIVFTLVSRYQQQQILIALSVGIFGFFGFALYPVCLELAVECTYPVAEATSSGFLIVSGQIQGILYILLAQVGAQPLIGAALAYQTCTDASNSGITPQDYTYPDLGLCVLTTVSAVFFIATFRPKYKRLQTEQQLAAERILNVNRPQIFNEFF